MPLGPVNVDANRAYTVVGRAMADGKDLRKLERSTRHHWLVNLYARNLQDDRRTNYNDRCYLPGTPVPADRTMSAHVYGSQS